MRMRVELLLHTSVLISRPMSLIRKEAELIPPKIIEFIC